MAGSGVSINWNGFTEALDKAAGGLAGTRDLMAEIGAAMKGQTVRRFAAGAGPDGGAWEPVAARAGRKGRAAPLVDTGRLRSSISFSAGDAEVFVGSNVAYARIHQLGGMAGRGRKVKIAARPYLGLSDEDREEIAALARKFLAECFRKS